MRGTHRIPGQAHWTQGPLGPKRKPWQKETFTVILWKRQKRKELGDISQQLLLPVVYLKGFNLNALNVVKLSAYM